MRSRDYQSKTTKEKLHSVISPFLEKRQFTHFYVAWGSLQKSTQCDEYQYPVGDFFFDIASLTKVLVTLPLILKFSNESHRALELSLESFLGASLGKELPPEISKLSVISLLRHSSHLPAWQNFWMNRLSPDFDAKSIDCVQRKKFILDRLSTWSNANLDSDELKFVYSDLGYLVLGLAIELMGQRDLSDIFDQFCTDDLGIPKPELFYPKNHQDHKYVPTSYCLIRDRLLVGEVHDENAASLGGSCGHAGLFASGAGLVEYLKCFFGSPLGKELLKVNRELFRTSESGQYLLGWQKDVFLFANEEPVIKHLGFTGTGIWIFPQRNAFIVILTNRISSSRTSSWIQGLRNEICKCIWEDSLGVLELVEDT